MTIEQLGSKLEVADAGVDTRQAPSSWLDTLADSELEAAGKGAVLAWIPA